MNVDEAIEMLKMVHEHNPKALINYIRIDGLVFYGLSDDGSLNHSECIAEHVRASNDDN